MKRKILIAIYVILILIMIKICYNMVVNIVLISNYNNGQYLESQAKLLTYVNFPQSYVANYNYGNILYQNGKYESAIEQYKKALSGIVPKDKECNIRINYALAICKTVQVDEKDQDSIKEAIETYESAINILIENGCANKDDNNGHNENAQQLKNDIQEEIDRLKKLLDEEQDDSDNSQEDNGDTTTEETETIETKIQEIKENATEQQRETESFYETYDKDYTRRTKNW